MCVGGALVSFLCLPELFLGVLFALSHVLGVSFVCSLALVHVFRGSL
jgi:hypothetical protein